MITITFPDNSTRQFPEGTTPMQVAETISKGLASRVLAAEVNGEIWDSSRTLHKDSSLRLLTWDDDGGKHAFWHSSAHLMAEALEALYPGIKFGIGPPVENGFYYDVDPGNRTISVEDLSAVEAKMTELARANNPFHRREVSKNEALDFFTQKGDEYKVELIGELQEGTITFYHHGNFTDLCRGPHLPHSGYIKAIKLLNVAGAYWRGDENRTQLTRIYGITFPQQKMLDDYLKMLEEAKKRDHRKIGREMKLFTFDDDVGPGLPLWLPRGGVIIEQLEKLSKNTEERAGYVRVRTPHIAKESMYLTSGHLPYYAESMFPPMEMEGGRYYLKAMNCPHHHKIYLSLNPSYRDLPLRLAEYGTCYRYEQSGELFGLMRVRSLQMNDAHIYCSRDQFASEFRAVNDMYLKYFKIFGIDKYVMRFSTHNPANLGKKYVDMPELWIQTEEMVRQVLVDSKIPFREVADEAAFYGPKIDVQIWSAIGREFTLATNQVDFAQPVRFGLTFVNKDNHPETPICIHRAPLGTHERFIGFLIEHYAGNFPVWLAPEQAIVLPIADRHNAKAVDIYHVLKNSDIRTLIDERGDKIGKKIRDAELMKIPYMVIIGDKEMESDRLSVRQHGKGDIGSMPLNSFTELIKNECTLI